MLHEGDLVATLIEVPALKLTPGDVGTVAYVSSTGNSVEVEFVNAAGETLGVESFFSQEVQKVESTEAVLHVHLNRAA